MATLQLPPVPLHRCHQNHYYRNGSRGVATKALTLQNYNALIREAITSSPPDASLALAHFAALVSPPSELTPNEYTLPAVLKSCVLLRLLPLGLQLHSFLVKSALFPSKPHCAVALLHLYSSLSSPDAARRLFDRIPDVHHVSFVPCWNSIILAYALHGFLQEALDFLRRMKESDIDVGASTWNSVLAGCVKSGDINLVFCILHTMLCEHGVTPDAATLNTILPVISVIPRFNFLREIHGFVLRNSHGPISLSDAHLNRLQAAISCGYLFHGEVDLGYQLFRDLEMRSCHHWNQLIAGLLSDGRKTEAFDAFREMAFECGREGIALSKVSLSLVLPECSLPTTAGREIHAYAYRHGLEFENSVCNALMAMYAKQGDNGAVVSDKVFHLNWDKDVVSWNTILSAHSADPDCMFALFRTMFAGSIRPDEYTISAMLNGCGFFSSLTLVAAFHSVMVKTSLSDVVVMNALMDAYGKCGSVKHAHKIFYEADSIDIISWNTIISCYGYSSMPEKAITLYHRMLALGHKPNRVTFIALLSACSHAGLPEEGIHYFNSMSTDHGIIPDLDHYSCIVDGLGRSGQLDRAHDFIKSMPLDPDDCTWSALLNSCRIHKNVELAEIAAENLIELDPGHTGYWVLLSNMYADIGRWSDVRHVRAAMRRGGLKKVPGASWIQVGGGAEIRRFGTGDKRHEGWEEVYATLDGLTEQMRAEGYEPGMELAAGEQEEEDVGFHGKVRGALLA